LIEKFIIQLHEDWSQEKNINLKESGDGAQHNGDQPKVDGVETVTIEKESLLANNNDQRLVDDNKVSIT